MSYARKPTAGSALPEGLARDHPYGSATHRGRVRPWPGGDSYACCCGSCPCWPLGYGLAGDGRTPLRAGGERDARRRQERRGNTRREGRSGQLTLQLSDLPSERPFGGERSRPQARRQRPCRLDMDGESEHDRWDVADLCRVRPGGDREDLVPGRLNVLGLRTITEFRCDGWRTGCFGSPKLVEADSWRTPKTMMRLLPPGALIWPPSSRTMATSPPTRRLSRLQTGPARSRNPAEAVRSDGASEPFRKVEVRVAVGPASVEPNSRAPRGEVDAFALV